MKKDTAVLSTNTQIAPSHGEVSVLHRVIYYNARNPEKKKRKRIMTTFLISVARFYKQISGEPSSRYDTHDPVV